MEFRILGPLEALEGRQRVALGGSKRRAVLALLLLHANETLGTDRMIDELWGEQPPAAAAKTLQVHISRLRKALGDGPGASDVVVTRAHGYELQLDLEHLDAHRFERLLAEGRSELDAGRPDAALTPLEQALSLWRGRPLADLAYEPFAQTEIARLEELRAAANERLIEAKLMLGRHVEVIGQLETLVDEYPYREGLRAQLMLAFYRADRQADALQAYQDARRALVEELGIEPGERLRELERGILAHDPGLAVGVAPPEAGAADEPEPAELPTGVVTFMLTDIEDSSGLWEADAEAMAAALELHDELIARAGPAHGGRVLKTKGEGDSTLTVFRRATDAVAGAVELQQQLAAIAWPGGLELRVRIAVHTGEAHEREGDFFGPALNRAARLRALARGGATVLSQATTEIVRDHLPQGAEVLDLGRRQLRGLSRPENVFELRVREPGLTATDQERRKTVTVLFACVGASASQGERLDPEARRRLIAPYWMEMLAVLERHGGTVETFPGDALMAVFGVPVLHEDDALRALRAAIDLREVLPEGDEAEPPVAIRLTVGVSTGEVIAARPAANQPLATGEAVNAARNLEELAEAAEILVDEPTHRLVRNSVRVQRAGSRASRSGESVDVLRLVEVPADANGRSPRLDSPLVGRDRQLGTLSTVFTAAVSDRACHLVSVLGAAGVGKSRLVREFTDGLSGEATVVRGRCLPYGEGITYWPLAEIVSELTPEASEMSASAIASQLGEDPRRDLIVAGIAEAVGLGGSEGGSSEKIFWSARRLFEVIAGRCPLVVVFDDLHWAEPTFLDLVEHVADLSRGAPIVILCMARPELLDERPGWGGGKLNATSILLEPLSEGDTEELIANLLSRATLPAETGARIAAATEGNPLFAEELLAMLIDDGLIRRDNGHWTVADDLTELPVPPTIHALLAARLEALPDHERALLAHASVEGTQFHRGALDALTPDSLAPDVERGLTALVRRDLIRPDRATFVDDETFRFRHMLIRDAAYRSLPKERRAELHQRFAGWLEQVAESRLGAFEEIAGYHLEQAFRLAEELGTVDAEGEELAGRGAAHLEAAGRRALARSDHTGALSLLERAAALYPEDHEGRTRLLPDVGAALIEAGRLANADDVLAEAARTASVAGDECAGARVLVQQQFLRLARGESAGTAEAAAVVEQVVPVFERGGDDVGLCNELRLRAWLHWIEAHADAAAGAWEQAASYALRAGAEHERTEILRWVALSLVLGPTPVADAIRRCEAIQSEVSANPAAAADVLQSLAALHAMEGRFDQARDLLAISSAVFEELGLTLTSLAGHDRAWIELVAGDPVAAEQSLRAGYSTLEEMGETNLLSTSAAYLAQALLAQQRDEEAEQFARVSDELATADDLLTQILWRGVRARTLAGRGRLEEAEEVARQAVALAERTDFINHRGDALVDFAIVMKQAGHLEEARAALTEGLGLYTEKGNTVAAGKAEAELAALAPI
jgi:class 3 adenylate cyclase/tetratricopeptide (TPR) repeat protein/DNA-binding winged helix-turn-helix (wHTH) protein